MTDYRRLTSVQSFFTGRLDTLFKELAGLEQDTRKQLAGVRYEV